jgi:hypothetical protein
VLNNVRIGDLFPAGGGGGKFDDKFRVSSVCNAARPSVKGKMKRCCQILS